MSVPWLTELVEAGLKVVEDEDVWGEDVGAKALYRSQLGDVLEEAGYPDEQVIAGLRAGENQILNRRWLRRIVENKLKYTDAAAAVQFLTVHAARFVDPYEEDDYEQARVGYGGQLAEGKKKKVPTMAWLVDILDNNVKTGQDAHFGFVPSDEVRAYNDEMWDQYHKLTGVVVPTETWHDGESPTFPFSCAC